MGKRFHKAAVRVNPEIRDAFQTTLVRWYRRNKRDLPWRHDRDPYRVWVSEVMLQQTRVDVVIGHYRRWMKSFPSVQALANAPSDKVLKHWEGLGYYSRARNLHRGAQLVVQRFGGNLPASVGELLTIPGIGRYTAGAVASIAFDLQASLVDGNVARVLARIFAIRDNVKEPATVRRLYALADMLLPARCPGDFNQALMELGALVCLPQSPRCEACPMRHVCKARARGLVDELPNRGQARKPVRLARDVIVAVCDGRLLVRQRPAEGQLAGMWELPAVDETPFQPGQLLAEVRHAITHYRITLRAFAAGAVDGSTPAGERWRWVSDRELRRLTLPSAHRKIVAVLRQGKTAGFDRLSGGP